MLPLEAGYMGAVQHLNAMKYQLANTGGSIYGVNAFYAPQQKAQDNLMLRIIDMSVSVVKRIVGLKKQPNLHRVVL